MRSRGDVNVRAVDECGHLGALCPSVEAVVDINDKRKKAMADRVIGACGGSVEGKTVAQAIKDLGIDPEKADPYFA